MLGLDTELSCFPTFNLRLNSFAPGLERVLSALHRTLLQRHEGTRNIHAPLVPVLTQLMLHFIDEWEVFALLAHLLNHIGWLDYSRDSLEASQSTLISLLHSHAVSQLSWLHKPIMMGLFQASTVSVLHRLKPDSLTLETFLKELTRNWFLWPFYQQPFWLAVSSNIYCNPT